MKYQKNKKIKERTEDLVSMSKRRVFIQFSDADHKKVPNRVDIQLDTSTEELNMFLNTYLQTKDENYSFYFKNYELQTNLKEILVEFSKKEVTSEETIILNYVPETLFQVRPITHISSSLEGHTQAVLDICFSPNNVFLASCSGDCSVIVWEASTEMPFITLTGHTNWVLTVAWSPDSSKLASADNSGLIIVWEINKIKKNLTRFLEIQKESPEKLGEFRTKLIGHTYFVTSLIWQPYHLNTNCNKLVSSSKDSTLRFWDTDTGQVLNVGARHKKSVTQITWSVCNKIYSASQDCNIYVWDENGTWLKNLQAHSHWVNCLSLSTFHAVRAGYLDYTDIINFRHDEFTQEEKMQKAEMNFKTSLKNTIKEYLATGSDDNTIMLFVPEDSDKALRRFAGHTAPINHIQFAPSGAILVSASFDKSLRIWSVFGDGCLGVLRAHVSEVYKLSFSRDSKWVVSGSKDSTIQVWSMKEKKRAYQLPGHADEVYGVDWSPDGFKLASGGKDKMVRIWKN